MESDIFGLLSKTENQARFFFKKLCWKSRHIFCTRCRSYKIYRILNKRYRCKRCGYTFHDFSNRWINKLNITFRQWIWIIKLFELEISTQRIADQVRLSYPTVLKAVTLLRAAILVNEGENKKLFQDEMGIDDVSIGKGHRKKCGGVSSNKILVIGIRRIDGIIKVEALDCITTESFFYKKNNTNPYNINYLNGITENHDYLMFFDSGYLRTERVRSVSHENYRINGLESFLSYARERLSRFHSVSREKLLLYMKEVEFRFNHRHEDLFILFARNLCNLMPS